MEVSSLRDRRLVALFATVVIVGAGASAAVVEIDGIPLHRGLPFSESAFAPEAVTPQLPTEPPPVVVAVREEPVPDPSPVPTPARAATPAPAPAPKSEPGPAPTPPTPAPPVVKVDTEIPRPAPRRGGGGGGEVVMASEPESFASEGSDAPNSHANGNRDPKPRHDDHVVTDSEVEPSAVEPPCLEPPRPEPALVGPPRVDDAPKPPRAQDAPKPPPGPRGNAGR